jgi:hypothetical protein
MIAAVPAASSAATSGSRCEPMKPVDRAWLRMDEPANLMVINGVMFFEAPLDRTRLRDMLAARLGQVRRFRQRAVRRSSTRWEWEDVPAFAIDDHLIEQSLPPGAGDDELRSLAAAQMALPLPAERPLWRIHLVHGYRGGSALLWRLHHCMGDGIALMVLMLAITDLDPEADRRQGSGAWGSDNPLANLFGETPMSHREALTHLEQFLPEGARLLAKPAEMLAATNRWLRRAASVPAFARLAGRWPDPRTPLKGKLGGEKRVAWSRAVPLEQVRAAKAAVGTAPDLAARGRQPSWRRRFAPPPAPTINDLLVAAIAGGLRRYLQGRGERLEGLSFRAVVPVSLRPVEQMNELGNCFGLVFLPLPVGIGEPRERLRELQRRMRSLKHSLEPVVALNVLALLGRVPKALQDVALRIFGAKGTAVLTNVPGPVRPLYLAGQAISGIVFWVPQSGHLGLGISIMTYAGQVRVGVASDANLIPDPEAIIAGFEEELQVLAELEGSPAAEPALAQA